MYAIKENATLASLYLAGLSIAQIAEREGLRKTLVGEVLRDSGVKMRPSPVGRPMGRVPLTKQQLKGRRRARLWLQISELRQAGVFDHAEIAARIGQPVERVVIITRYFIQKRIKSHGR